MRMVWVAVLIGAVMPVLTAMGPPAHAQDSCVQVGWDAVDADCEWTYPEYVTASSSGEQHTWATVLKCNNGGICADEIACSENGVAGFWHDVFKDGVDVGDVCVPEAAVSQVDVVSLILRRFRELKWPASELVVQPPGGKTLVNFETNFYTDDDEPVEKNLRVAGRDVAIRAVQVTYTFRFGDGTVLDSDSPGRPNPYLDVTHIYTKADPVQVSLDTTYSGEYRIGDGEWTPLDVTLTVPGAAQDLDVVEALPQLVLR